MSVMTHPGADAIPTFEGDFWSEEVLLNPYPHYRQLRDLGSAVWCSRHDAWALTRFESVRNGLRNAEVFSSAKGCMMNEAGNNAFQGVMLCSDDPKHMEMRRIFAKPLMPAALAPLKTRLTDLAETRITELLARKRFDAVHDLAHFLPLTVVTELVGLSEEGKGKMLAWASAIFDAFGPDTQARTLEGMDVVMQAFGYIQKIDPAELDPGGWGAALFRAADQGKIAHASARAMLMDYLAPSLDTTINATSALIELMAKNPDQWARLRANPALIPGAIDETIRLESPIRAFSRYVTRDHTVDGVLLPEGARVLMLYACANRDERRFQDPDKFDIGRNARDQLGFGNGTHSCPGMHLAKLEITTLLEILVRRVTTFRVVEAARTPHNTLRGLAKLTVEFTAA